MKLKLLGGVALAGVFAASGAFAAPADTGWYGAVDIGAHIMQPLNTTSSANEFRWLALRVQVLAGHQLDRFRPGRLQGFAAPPHRARGRLPARRVSARSSTARRRPVTGVCGIASTAGNCRGARQLDQRLDPDGQRPLGLHARMGVLIPSSALAAGVAGVNMKLSGEFTPAPRPDDQRRHGRHPVRVPGHRGPRVPRSTTTSPPT